MHSSTVFLSIPLNCASAPNASTAHFWTFSSLRLSEELITWLQACSSASVPVMPACARQAIRWQAASRIFSEPNVVKFLEGIDLTMADIC
jgi:hypothetical protein